MLIRLTILTISIIVVVTVVLSFFYTNLMATFESLSSDSEIAKNIYVENNETPKFNDEIQKLVKQIYDSNEKTRLIAKAKIIKLEKNSKLDRKKIIDSIILSLDISNIQHEMVSPNLNYDGWTTSLMILGEIKATESLSILIKCLSCNNGMGGNSIYRYPVAYAISMIGEDSIPYLEESLRNSDLENTSRLCALLALDSIGGEKSKKALEEALVIEKNESFRKIIKNLLADK